MQSGSLFFFFMTLCHLSCGHFLLCPNLATPPPPSPGQEERGAEAAESGEGLLPDRPPRELAGGLQGGLRGDLPPRRRLRGRRRKLQSGDR